MTQKKVVILINLYSFYQNFFNSDLNIFAQN